MRIAIFGSSYSRSPVEPINNKEHFAPTCNSIGQMVGRAGHALLVQSDSRRSADRHVVDGVRQLESLADGCEVRAWHRTKPKADGTSKPEPFHDYAWVLKEPAQFAHVGSAHIDMLHQADVALVIGGGPHAYLAGQTALAMDVRLVPVSAFGGAGRLLWQEVRRNGGPASAKLMDSTRLAQLATVSKVVKSVTHELETLPRIMVVHGRDTDGVDVARTLRRLGAAAFTLEELSEWGGTIPEEFEEKARTADGAVILLTPDDEGRPATDIKGNPIDDSETARRARQNVVLEYGWSWCRFGRKEVLPLVKGRIKLPSDLDGVLNVRYENATELDDVLEAFVAKFRK